jgi:hypothetical protein
MQVDRVNVHANAAAKANDVKGGAIVQRSVTTDENGGVIFSKSLSLPNGKSMTSERIFSRDDNGFSMRMDKTLPNGRRLIIDVTKTNGVEVTNPPADDEADAQGIEETTDPDQEASVPSDATASEDGAIPGLPETEPAG